VEGKEINKGGECGAGNCRPANSAGPRLLAGEGGVRNVREEQDRQNSHSLICGGGGVTNHRTSRLRGKKKGLEKEEVLSASSYLTDRGEG